MSEIREVKLLPKGRLVNRRTRSDHSGQSQLLLTGSIYVSGQGKVKKTDLRSNSWDPVRSSTDSPKTRVETSYSISLGGTSRKQRYLQDRHKVHTASRLETGTPWT